MIRTFFKKYFSIIFILATFIGVSHYHHHDVEPHNNCKVCTLQYNLLNANTPTEINYLSEIDLIQEPIFTTFFTIIDSKFYSIIKARAPPKLS